MPSRIEKVEFVWEKTYPTILGCAFAALALWKGPSALEAAAHAQWKWDNLYGTVFNLSAISTPFLFTFYTVFVTAESGFIGRMRKTRSFRATVVYTLRAIYLGAALILTSLPFLLIVPLPSGRTDPWAWAFAIWFGLFIAAGAAFYRAARQFQLFLKVQAHFSA